MIAARLRSYMHLTNYSVNKKSQNFVRNQDVARDDEGSKWSLTALYKHLAAHGVDVAALQARAHASSRFPCMRDRLLVRAY